MPHDLLVKLYALPSLIPNGAKLQQAGIKIHRVLPADKYQLTAYIKEKFAPGWASECEIAFSNNPVSCYIAVKDRQIIGFACYNATCPGFFGPTGVSEKYRSQGIGAALLFKCLLAMKEAGYAYAIIGLVDEALAFYQKTVNAIVIEDSCPGIYQRLINSEI